MDFLPRINKLNSAYKEIDSFFQNCVLMQINGEWFGVFIRPDVLSKLQISLFSHFESIHVEFVQLQGKLLPTRNKYVC